MGKKAREKRSSSRRGQARAPATVRPRPRRTGRRGREKSPTPDPNREEIVSLSLKSELDYQELLESRADIEDSRDHYAELFNLAPVGYLTLNSVGVILDLNASAARLLGGQPVKLIGMPMLIYVDGEYRQLFRRHLRLGKKENLSTELKLVDRAYRGSVYVELVSAPSELKPSAIKCVLVDVTARHSAEISRQHSEERFRAVIEFMEEAIVVVNEKGWISYYSPAAARFLGYRPEGRHGRLLPHLIHKRERRRAQRWFIELARNRGATRTMEIWLRGFEEKWRRIHVIGQNLLHQSSIGGIVLNARDLTQRRQVEEALSESEERLRLAQEAGGIGSFDWDARTGRILISATCRSLFGYPASREWISVDEWQRRMHPADRASFRRHLLERVEESGYAKLEYRIVRVHDRQVRWISHTERIYESDGRPVRILGTIQDITDVARARQVLQRSKDELERLVGRRTAQLRRNEQELAAFFEQAPMGILWVSPSGRIQRVNRIALELLGRPREECVGRVIPDFYKDVALAREVLQRLARRETLDDHYAVLVRPDGGARHVLISANGLWEKGRLQHSRWFIRDKTIQVELEREILLVSEREQRRIGQDLHDDLCQQLTGIEYLSQTLASRLSSVSKADAGRAREIGRMVREAMDYTRDLARGLSPLRLEAEGLRGTLRELAKRTRKLFGVQCRFRCKEAVEIHDVNISIHLYRIVQEAVANALKHGKARNIEIGLVANKKHLIVAVRDDGVGIPRKSRTHQGMGLYTMQYRAGVIGGTLVVQGNSDGGATVVCTIKHVT